MVMVVRTLALLSIDYHQMVKFTVFKPMLVCILIELVSDEGTLPSNPLLLSLDSKRTVESSGA